MALHITINQIEVTKYLVPALLPVLDDTLNEPKILTFSLYPADQNLPVPIAGQKVLFYSDSINLFSGYIVSTPQLGVITPGIVGYNVESQSEDWQFDSKVYGIVPDFVAQYAGDILIQLMTLAGGTAITSSIPQGPFLPRFTIDPTWVFTDAAKALCDKVGYRWYVLDDTLYFISQNDVPYGYDIDSTNPDFNLAGLTLKASSTPIVNDATAIGYSEPKLFTQDNFLGDGNANSFTLSETFSGSPDDEIVFRDPFVSSVIASIWTEIDPSNAIAYTTGKLTVSGGSQQYGTALIYANNSLELGGELLFDAGSFTFADLSTGILGGVYSGGFDVSDCLVGFACLGNTQTCGIQALVQGQKIGTVIVTDSLHAYDLQIYLSVDETFRYYESYESISGRFGGTTIPSNAYVTLVVTETSLVNPSETPTTTVIYDGHITNVPPFGTFSLVNGLAMYLSAVSGATITALPNIRVRSTANGRVLGTHIAQNPDFDWVVSLPYTPTGGEGVSATYRSVGVPEARLINPISITNIGTKAVSLTLPSSVRTSTDCENILQAYLSDYASTLYEGIYTTKPMQLGVRPESGRYLSVNYPNITSLFSSIVTDNKLSVNEMGNETVTLYTVFGFAAQITPYETSNIQGTIPPLNLTTVPQSLPEISSVTNTSVTGSEINVDAGRPPIYGFEVRNGDSNWGQGGYLYQFFTEDFALARVSRSDQFFIREFDHGLVPFYSRNSVLLEATGYPITPLPPVLTLASINGLSIVIDLSTENRNDIVQEILEVASDSGFTDIVAEDNEPNQFSESTLVMPTGGTYYARARKATVIGFGTNTVSPLVFSVTSPIDTTPPDPPTAFAISNQTTVTEADGSINVTLTFTWTASISTNVIGYRLRWSTFSTGPFTSITTDNVTTATIYNLWSNQLYYFSIAAVGGGGVTGSYTSNLVFTTGTPLAPSIPTGLAAVGGFRLVGLSWNANPEKNIAGYIVQWCLTSGGTYTTIATISTTYYIDQGDQTRGQLGITTTYYYKIAAVDTNGNTSSFTTSVNATTLPINTQDIDVAGISVGGGTLMPGVVTVYDNASNIIGYIGQFISTIFGGTTFGGWFKTLGVGGTVNSPGIIADSFGVVNMLDASVGSSTTAGAIQVYDNASNIIGYIGRFVSSLLGGAVFGAWFKTLAIGGTVNNPNMAADSSGTVSMLSVNVGNSSSTSGIVQIYDNSNHIIGYIGQFSSTILGGTAYGGWFKTLGVGGTVNAPGLLADSSGNVNLLTGGIKNAAGQILITAGATDMFANGALSGTVSYTTATGQDIINGFVDYYIQLSGISVSPSLPADFQYFYILVADPSGYFKPYYINNATPKLTGLLENTVYTVTVYAADKFGRYTAGTTTNVTTPSTGKITGSTCMMEQGSIVISSPPNWSLSSALSGGTGSPPAIYAAIPIGFPVYFSDGSSVILNGGIPSGGNQYFSWGPPYITLAYSTVYYFYPYFDVATGAVHFAGGGTPSVGPYPADLDPPSSTPLTSPSVFAAMNCFLDGRAGASTSQINITTPTSGGTGGGTGGGGNSCVEENTYVDIQGRGYVKAITVKEGEFIKGRNMKTGENIYRRISWTQVEVQSHWKSIKGTLVTLFEPVWIGDKWEFAFRVPGAEDVRKQSRKIKINVEISKSETYDDHNFYAGELLIHNTFPINS